MLQALVLLSLLPLLLLHWESGVCQVLLPVGAGAVQLVGEEQRSLAAAAVVVGSASLHAHPGMLQLLVLALVLPVLGPSLRHNAGAVKGTQNQADS